jgi:virginiamycin B lyase
VAGFLGAKPLETLGAPQGNPQRAACTWRKEPEVSRKCIVTTLVIAAITILAASGAVSTARADGPPACTSDCAALVAGPYDTTFPFGVTPGPLGSEWFSLGHDVARVDQRGNVSTYPVSDPNEQRLGWMTRAPDGTVWFCERDTGKVGEIDAAGHMREYQLPSSDAVPQGIVFAPNGDVYLPDQGVNGIWRLNPQTGDATLYPSPTPDATVQSGVLGPDGAIWFIERAAAMVGRMTLDGHFTEYPLADGAFPNRIVVGPDGALWFTELFAGKIGRITTSGNLTEYPVDGGPVGITVGKDGQLYTALFFADGVARINLQGQVTGEWSLPGSNGPLQIATGTGLSLYITANGLYRLTPYDTGPDR